MSRTRPVSFVPGRPARAAWAAAVVLAGQVAVAAVPAQGAPPTSLAIGVSSGVTQLDAKLADYQWDTAAHPAWGIAALAGRGRLAVGPRFRMNGSTQDMSAAGVATSPAVRLRTYDVVARVQVAEWASNRLLASASFGRLQITYDPDHAMIAGGTAVAFAPIGEWTSGAGVAAEHSLGSRWSMGLELEANRFSLDTAHRSGATVVYGRDALVNWNARIGLARLFTWR